MTMRPDPTFHASPKLAMEAPPENFAYTLLLSPDFSKPDALAVIDVKPGSPTFSQIVHTVTMPNKGDEFHHFGWNACSSPLSPLSGHAFLERRYLIIPGLRSSRIYVVDTKAGPTQAKIHKIIEPEEVFRKTGYSRPHTIHCGPEGIYVSTLGGSGPDGTIGPPGIFVMDCETFEVLGRWEMDRGPQDKHYDFWWNLPRDYMVSSEWALPPQFEKGIVPEDLLSNKYGHRLHFWDLGARRNVQTIDLGPNHQMALEVRPAHDPIKEYGFVGVVVDTTNLEGSIWTWWREGGKFHCKKTAVIPPEPAEKNQLPPLLQGFGAVPPLITDIDLSLDDRFLYVSCWGTGEMRQYDVSDPHAPKLAASRGEPRTQTARHLAAGHRWSRSAAMASGSIGLIRCIRPGTTSSIRMVCLARWSRLTLAPAGVSAWTKISGSSFPTDIDRIRSGLRGATARPTLSAIRLSEGARHSMDHSRSLAGSGRQRFVSRPQSRSGMAIGRFRRNDG